MSFRVSAIAASLFVLSSAAHAQQADAVDCTDPANAGQPDCTAALLPVPSLATNAGPLLALPAGVLALGALGGGGSGAAGSTGSTGSTGGTGLN